MTTTETDWPYDADRDDPRRRYYGLTGREMRDA